RHGCVNLKISLNFPEILLRRRDMDVGGDIVFPPFLLDLSNERLWRGVQEVVLRPKTFALLRHLVLRAGHVVKKEELLDALWPGTLVGDDGIIVCVRELRRALGDDSRTPQFIETLRKRGYRFIAPLTAAAPPIPGSKFPVPSSLPSFP